MMYGNLCLSFRETLPLRMFSVSKVCMHVCMYVCMYSMYVCMYVSTYSRNRVNTMSTYIPTWRGWVGTEWAPRLAHPPQWAVPGRPGQMHQHRCARDNCTLHLWNGHLRGQRVQLKGGCKKHSWDFPFWNCVGFFYHAGEGSKSCPELDSWHWPRESPAFLRFCTRKPRPVHEKKGWDLVKLSLYREESFSQELCFLNIYVHYCHKKYLINLLK